MGNDERTEGRGRSRPVRGTRLVARCAYGVSEVHGPGQNHLAASVMLGELLRLACLPERESLDDRDDELPLRDCLREGAEACGIRVGKEGANLEPEPLRACSLPNDATDGSAGCGSPAEQGGGCAGVAS